VLHFKGARQTLPLNMSNFDAVAAICGDDTDHWPGHKIELYPSTTALGGQMVPCIRIRRVREFAPPPPSSHDKEPAF
jgi:hypothetical protein